MKTRRHRRGFTCPLVPKGMLWWTLDDADLFDGQRIHLVKADGRWERWLWRDRFDHSKGSDPFDRRRPLHLVALVKHRRWERRWFGSRRRWLQ